MKLVDLFYFRYHVLCVLLLAWLLRAVIGWPELSVIFEAVLGIGITIVVAWLFRRTSKTPKILWNSSSGTLALLRPFKVEVSAARVLGSVPLGIDLTHAAAKVLKSVYNRMLDGSSGFVRFFLSRPFNDGPTLVGFMVTRQGFRLMNGVSQAEKLSSEIYADALVLESSMRSAYPHLPVTSVCLEEMLSIYGGDR